MKIALLLPGYLDSPDYLHMKYFETGLKRMGYATERIDPCGLWETGNITNYSITNYLKQVEERVMYFAQQNPQELVLIGHSLGGLVAIIAGNRLKSVTRIVALCPPPDRKNAAAKWNGNAIHTSVRDLPDNPEQTRTFDVPISFAEDGAQYSAVEDVKYIRKPLMIFIGMKDVVVSPDRTEEIVSAAHDPFVVRDELLGHDFRKSEEETTRVMNAIESFLQV